MENKLDVIQTEEYQEAISTHQKIMANMDVAATAIVDLCKNLKIMRDKKLYTNLGMESFEEYSEQMAGIKQRQAYNYISIYERYGETVLQSNANLGITKLEILTALPDTKRDDFLEENDVESMSTRELKEAIKKLEETKEQLSLLTNERDNLKSSLEGTEGHLKENYKLIEYRDNRIYELEQEIKELQETPTDVAVEELSPEELEKIRSEAEQKIKEEYDKKIKKERDKASSAKNELKVLKESQEEKTKKAIAEATEQVKKNLEQTEQEKAQLLERTKEMEQSLMTAANPELIKAEFYFDQLREADRKLYTIIHEMYDTDPDTANKLAGAVIKYYEQALNEMSVLQLED